jgi:hypothetical protein
MPQQRMDIRMIKDILRLKYQGDLSHERIAQSLGISKGAVAKYLSLAGGAGLDWASTAELDEASLERRLMGSGAALSRVVEPDYARVHIELRRKGVTLMLVVGRIPRGPRRPADVGVHPVLRSLQGLRQDAQALDAPAAARRREALHRLRRTDPRVTGRAR